MMSRPVAGTRNKTLIITLPGSPKGAKENLLAVLKLLPHACQQAAGEDSRSAHTGGVKKLEQDAGIARSDPSDHELRDIHQHDRRHDHSHGEGRSIPTAHTQPNDRPMSNDPNAGPTARHRVSPYPMLTVDEATKVITANSPQPTTEKVSVDIDLVGHILAQDVLANHPVPAYRASIVDGYALVLPSGSKTESKATFPVASVLHATPGEVPQLNEGQLARITTGAPLPPGAHAVVMVEDTAIKSMTADGREEEAVEILALDKIREGENVREIGSDIKTGQYILRKGDVITAVGGELGLLASVGKSEVLVYKRPTVGVMSTGDEIVEHDRPGSLRMGEVRDCNRPTLMAAVRSWGYEVVDLGIAKDKAGALEASLRSALKSVDVIVTSGGVSMGEFDLLKPTLERSLGGTIHFGRVAMKPGKPTTFATVPCKDASGNHQAAKPIFSLPGNPASALVTAHLFVLPCLQRMSGKAEPFGLTKAKVVLAKDVDCDPNRPDFHRVALHLNSEGKIEAISTGGQRSSKVGSLKGASGLLCLPAGGGVLREGQMVDALLMGDLRGL